MRRLFFVKKFYSSVKNFYTFTFCLFLKMLIIKML